MCLICVSIAIARSTIAPNVLALFGWKFSTSIRDLRTFHSNSNWISKSKNPRNFDLTQSFSSVPIQNRIIHKESKTTSSATSSVFKRLKPEIRNPPIAARSLLFTPRTSGKSSEDTFFVYILFLLLCVYQVATSVFGVLLLRCSLLFGWRILTCLVTLESKV